jgi:hypothetical protein
MWMKVVSCYICSECNNLLGGGEGHLNKPQTIFPTKLLVLNLNLNLNLNQPRFFRIKGFWVSISILLSMPWSFSEPVKKQIKSSKVLKFGNQLVTLLKSLSQSLALLTCIDGGETPLRVTCSDPMTSCTIEWKWRLQDYESISLYI